MKLRSRSRTISIGFAVASIGIFSGAVEAQAPQPVKPPAIHAPSVRTPKAPTVAAPTAVAPAASTAAAPQTAAAASAARATLVATAYSEAAYTASSTSGVPIVLVFSSATDPIWATQATALQTILREPEFSQGPNYQIDTANTDIAEKFAVKNAATIIIMKDGVERMRSTRMTKPDVIRKMLRLKTAL